MASVTGEFYVQLRPEFYRYEKDRVRSLRAVKITQKRPENPEGGCFVVKVVVEGDADMFRMPEARIVLEGAEARIAVAEIQSWIAKP